MRDVADRIKCRVQLTTDGHRAYLNAVEDALASTVDYAQLQKIYGASNEPEVSMGKLSELVKRDYDLELEVIRDTGNLGRLE